MNAAEFIRQLAWQIVEMEEEAGCVGMTANHLMTLIDESIKAEPDNFPIARYLSTELDQATQEKEDEVTLHETFDSIVAGINVGGEEQ